MKARYWITAALCLATHAWASPLASYTDDYKTWGWFGTVKHDYKTIAENSSWFGHFDFAVADYALIDKFSLTLNFSATARHKPKEETWKLYVQGWSDFGPTDGFALTPVVGENNTATGVYTIDKNNKNQVELFRTLIKDRYFSFWFEDKGTKRDNTFLLYDAKLDIYAKAADVIVPSTPTGPAAPTNGVPEPASLALLGLGLAGLGGLRRGKPRV